MDSRHNPVSIVLLKTRTQGQWGRPPVFHPGMIWVPTLIQDSCALGLGLLQTQ